VIDTTERSPGEVSQLVAHWIRAHLATAKNERYNSGMNEPDPFADLKRRQREMWASFTPTAIFTTPVAGHLVRFAGVAADEDVLDVGTGTGVVAITAARAGARVTGLDLTPELLDQARENARIAQMPHIVWTEGDAENLPYPDASFDLVVSQFGHMFAPRPEIAVTEMRRVLKPGGRIAFATWPPEHFVGRLFAFVGRNSPPPPVGAAPHRSGATRRSSRSAWRPASTPRSSRGAPCAFRR